MQVYFRDDHTLENLRSIDIFQGHGRDESFGAHRDELVIDKGKVSESRTVGGKSPFKVR